jgi:sugar O-acyltransferase (sialic acid O-acetyltransferase NeuD family)
MSDEKYDQSMNDPQRKVVLLGGGGHAAVVADAAQAAGWSIVGYLDDRSDTGLQLMRLGTIDNAEALLANLPGDVAIHAAVGCASLRQSWLALANQRSAATIIHPSAVVSPSATIEGGVFIGPLAVINARASIRCGAIINSGAIIEHDCTIGVFSHIAPRAALAGGASVGDSALVGCGAVVLPNVHIGDGATLGAGSVATSDVPAGATAIGAPARVPAAAR